MTMLLYKTGHLQVFIIACLGIFSFNIIYLFYEKIIVLICIYFIFL